MNIYQNLFYGDKKEQFSDGVGYNWVDSLIKETENIVTEFDIEEVRGVYPYKHSSNQRGIIL